MKKTTILLLFAAILIFSSCSETKVYVKNEVEIMRPWQEPVEIEILDTDVVNTHGRVKNIEFLDEFVLAARRGEKATLRLIRYTIEGDPIINTLTSGPGAVRNVIDATNDQYGGGMHYETFEKIFSRKVQEEGKDYVEYVVVIDSEEYVYLRAIIE